jgi:hypothetical protein
MRTDLSEFEMLEILDTIYEKLEDLYALKGKHPELYKQSRDKFFDDLDDDYVERELKIW